MEADEARASTQLSSGSFTSLSVASIEHPKLFRQDAEFVRSFLRAYDQYVKEVQALAAQLGANGNASTDIGRPISLKFCVDAGMLESSIALGFIDGVASYDELDDIVRMRFLKDKAKESTETLPLSTFDCIVSKKLRMEMRDRSATSRMQGLFVSYHSLLRDNGLTWVLDSSQKIAVQHVLAAIRPQSLQNRLKEDLEWANHDLRRDFKGFMQHAIKVAEAFQLVDNGRTKPASTSDDDRFGSTSSRGGGRSSRFAENRNQFSDSSTRANEKSFRNNQHATKEENKLSGKGKPNSVKKETKDLPSCPEDPCKRATPPRKHWLNDCEWCNPEEKRDLRAKLRSEKAQAKEEHKSKKADGTDRRLGSHREDNANCSITVQDGTSSMSIKGRCDDGSDDTLVSPTFTEQAVLSCIGRIRKIRPVSLAVGLKKGTVPESFQFSRAWIVPRTIIELSTGPLAIANVSYLVADDDLSSESILIGNPVLRHLQVDTMTLLEQQRNVLDGTDCSVVGNPTIPRGSGYVTRIMTARTSFEHGNEREEILPKNSNTNNGPDPDRPRMTYWESRSEVDPIQNTSLLDPVDSDQFEDIQSAVSYMIEQAITNGLPREYHDILKDIVKRHINIFRTGLSSGPLANLLLLPIELIPNAVPSKVKLRNYSKAQKEFLADFSQKLVSKGMAFTNPTAAWVSAPLLVPKKGEVPFIFTGDLRRPNKFTKKHQYQCPTLTMSSLS